MAYVVDPSGLVASVDLDTLGVAYHQLGSGSLLTRIANWLTPAAEAKEANGSQLSAQWLGKGLMAVAGVQETATAQADTYRPMGLQILGTRSWSVRMLDPRADTFMVANGALLVTGTREGCRVRLRTGRCAGERKALGSRTISSRRTGRSRSSAAPEASPHRRRLGPHPARAAAAGSRRTLLAQALHGASQLLGLGAAEHRIAAMGIALALFLAAGFGAGDQYLGSLAGHSWGGAPRASPRRGCCSPSSPAAAGGRRGARRCSGSPCTAPRSLGYWLMTDSPVEGAAYTLANARGFFVSNGVAVVGGLVTGPLFGWFGQQWRTRRAMLGALVSAAALCLEPLVRHIPVGAVRVAGIGYALTRPVGSRPSWWPRSPPGCSSPRTSRPRAAVFDWI